MTTLTGGTSRCSGKQRVWPGASLCTEEEEQRHRNLRLNCPPNMIQTILSTTQLTRPGDISDPAPLWVLALRHLCRENGKPRGPDNSYRMLGGVGRVGR